MAEDEPIANGMDYKIKIHNVIHDTVAESSQCRSDISCMDPKHLPGIREKGPSTDSHEGAPCLLGFEERVTVEMPQAETHQPCTTPGTIEDVTFGGAQRQG